MWIKTSNKQVHQIPEQIPSQICPHHQIHGANTSCLVFKRALNKKIKISPKVPSLYTKSRTETYSEATRNQDSFTDHISVILSQFITNLNYLITNY